MTEMEKAEKLREKADVSFAEAKAALDNSGGDILDAMIYLENQGKVTVPAGGGFFSGADLPAEAIKAASETGSSDGSTRQNDGSGEEFADLMKRLGAFILKLLHKGLNNHLEASKGDKIMFTCPVIVILLLALCFWITIPLFIVSLFLGFRYRFTGEDLGKESVNNAMNSASNIVDDVKKSFADNTNKEKE